MRKACDFAHTYDDGMASPPTRRLNAGAAVAWALIGLCVVGMAVFFIVLPAGV